ncbi:MAG: MerR family transcriptional regulator [Bdellovibrionales bacterium]|nr:MerR family transcriptional regulator [Bdellovibrionales bacterium]
MFGPIEIPNKSSFKINEVCALTGVKSYVLRFWESEFEEILPIVSSSGQKLYEHRDIEAILLIKKLLFEDKMTIERAKAEMKMLMPRESLVEQGFAESYSYEDDTLDADEFLKSEVRAEVIHAGAQANPITLTNPVMTKRVLIETDFQKLMLAKSKLVEILNITESLHQKNHWT